MIEIFTWTMAVLSVFGLILNIKKLRGCFLIWTVTNIGWMLYDFYIEAYAQSALFAVYLGLSIWGMVKWRREAAERKPGGGSEMLSDYVHIQTRVMADKQATEIDKWIGIHIKPKPRWMPKRTYEWFLRTLVELRYFDKPPMTTQREVVTPPHERKEG